MFGAGGLSKRVKANLKSLSKMLVLLFLLEGEKKRDKQQSYYSLA